ncbi:MAG: helix-turn-helix domain-containing protein [Dethiobacteria bacterium]
MPKNKLGIRIRAFRRLKRMTQQQFAEKLNFSASQLSNIERGVKIPGPELLEKMAAILEIPRDELFIVSEETKKHMLV